MDRVQQLGERDLLRYTGEVARQQKSIVGAYMLFVLGGSLGVHEAYLERWCRAAIATSAWGVLAFLGSIALAADFAVAWVALFLVALWIGARTRPILAGVVVASAAASWLAFVAHAAPSSAEVAIVGGAGVALLGLGLLDFLTLPAQVIARDRGIRRRIRQDILGATE